MNLNVVLYIQITFRQQSSFYLKKHSELSSLLLLSVFCYRSHCAMNCVLFANFQILEHLLTKYTRASFQDQSQQTPLHLAAQGGRSTHVEALGKVMAGVNERDDQGMTPLHLAAMKGNR